MLAFDEHSDSEGVEWDLASHLRRRFGRYELVGKLGSGGMANVYLARAAGPGGFTKLVAVKCIHPHLADDPCFIDMFLDEARIAACIEHPNVCSAFDFGEIDGIYFLAMDYLVGEPWSEVLRSLHEGIHGRSAAERHAFAARIVADAAEGLHAAHEAVGPDGAPLEVVHRDVAPPNLFLRYDGQVQVVDFGCAKAAKRIFRTEYGKVRGHIAYVAPELLRGQEADRRADVWSLGVVLWELLTGVRLFRRTSLHDTMFAVASDEVPVPSKIAPSVPEALDAIVMRALSRDLDERYATARALAEALSGFLRESGAPMGLRHLAAWMDALFPGGRARAARVVELVGKRSEAPPRPARRPSPRLSGEIPTKSELPRVRIDRVSEEPPTRIVTPARPSFTAKLKPLWKVRRRTAITGLGLLLAVGAGTVLDELGFASGKGPTGEASAWRAPADVDRPAPAPSETDRAVTVQNDATAAPSAPETEPEVEVERDTPPPPAERPGRINVLTPGGWANVLLGDRRLGPTPGQFTLPAGRHRLRLVPGEGEGEQIVWVTVRSGRVTRVVQPLE